MRTGGPGRVNADIDAGCELPRVAPAFWITRRSDIRVHVAVRVGEAFVAPEGELGRIVDIFEVDGGAIGWRGEGRGQRTEVG